MFVSRLGFLCLVSSSVVRAQDFWEETSCESLDITQNNLQPECLALCSPFQSEIFDGLNRTDEAIYQVLRCVCSDSTGCLDQQVILDRTQPVPTCDALGIEAIEDCNPICSDLKMPMKVFRDVNGRTECTCEDADICNDDPTCAQLKIFPGSAAEDCAQYCGPDVTAVSTDEVEFAGGAFVANKDQTHLRVSCMCGAFEECLDSILFSDVARIEGCRDELQIFSDDQCQDYCEDFGFTADAEYFSLGLFRNCTCASAEGIALACQDAPGVQSGTDDETDDGADDENTSSASGPSVHAVLAKVGSIITVVAMLS
jgi:hypothetical protein